MAIPHFLIYYNQKYGHLDGEKEKLGKLEVIIDEIMDTRYPLSGGWNISKNIINERFGVVGNSFSHRSWCRYKYDGNKFSSVGIYSENYPNEISDEQELDGVNNYNWRGYEQTIEKEDGQTWLGLAQFGKTQ